MFKSLHSLANNWFCFFWHVTDIECQAFFVFKSVKRKRCPEKLNVPDGFSPFLVGQSKREKIKTTQAVKATPYIN